MKNKNIYRFIKSECGRAKYENLILNKTFFGKIRLYWFIFFATLKDININNLFFEDSCITSLEYLVKK